MVGCVVGKGSQTDLEFYIEPLKVQKMLKVFCYLK